VSSTSIFRTSSAAITYSSPSSTEMNDGSVMVSVERAESTTDCETRNPIVRLLESSFLGAKNKNTSMVEEMRELDGCVKIVQSPITKSSAGDYDICREYNYSGDEDDNIYFQDQQSEMLAQFSNENILHTYVLGKTYHPINDYSVKREDESSFFLFTYRCDFTEIAPYGITSDAGWGCMLRSAMMMLAHAMRLHYKGRGWKPPQQLQRRRQDPFVRSLLTWFADFPSSDSNLYSLHNMVAAGLDRHVLPGEWYGPGTVCYVLRDLVELHEKLQAGATHKVDKRIFRVHVAANASLYKSSVEELMTRDSKTIIERRRAKLEKESTPTHPLDNAWECELLELESNVRWDTALLLFIPLRLGLKAFNQDYVQALAHVFSLQQSVGVLGGRPRGARWFYGAVADGSKIFGLDPHTVQPAPRKRTAMVNGVLSHAVELSDDYMRSVHTNYPEAFCLSKMDPSIALGFYCKDRDDFLDLILSLEEWKQEHPDLPELFCVSEAAPDYSANVSSVMDDMLGSQTMNGSLMDDDESVVSDEDEYVVL
jgi:cysteine protease ATG4